MAKMWGTTCTVEDCKKDSFIKDKECHMHYMRMRKYNSYDLPETSFARREVDVRLIRDELGRKHCPFCNEWLDVSEFHSDKGKGDGLTSRCWRCIAIKYRYVKYKLDNDTYQSMLSKQDNKCAVCDKPLKEKESNSRQKNFSWHVDHDHSCCPNTPTCGNCTRGLVCYKCNTLLGLAEDNLDTLKNAIIYLSGRTNGRRD